MRTVLRCRCSRFLAEFREGIPVLLNMKLPPCPRCKVQLVVVDGNPEWYPPGQKLPEVFDRVSSVG